MALIRKAANVTVQNSVISGFEGGPTQVPASIINNGAGVAQIDSFQLLYISPDEPESEFGASEFQPNDIRYVGYRVLTVNETVGLSSHNHDECTYLFEFAFQTWERQQRLTSTFFEIQMDTDGDNEVDHTVFTTAIGSVYTSSMNCLVRHVKTGEVTCGLAHDHGTNTAITVMRVCSEALSIDENPGTLTLAWRAYSVTHLGETRVMEESDYAVRVSYPMAEIAAPSYDIFSGETLESILVYGTNEWSNGYPPLGLMLVTNSYRSPQSTGAAVAGSETVLLLQDLLLDGFIVLPNETSPDLVLTPKVKDFRGPDCSWTNTQCTVATSQVDLNMANMSPFEKNIKSYQNHPDQVDKLGYQTFQASDFLSENEKAPSCPPVEIPRASVPTKAPTVPTLSPTTLPSVTRTGLPSYEPSQDPTTQPSMTPTFVQSLSETTTSTTASELSDEMEFTFSPSIDSSFESIIATEDFDLFATIQPTSSDQTNSMPLRLNVTDNGNHSLVVVAANSSSQPPNVNDKVSTNDGTLTGNETITPPPIEAIDVLVSTLVDSVSQSQSSSSSNNGNDNADSDEIMITMTTTSLPPIDFLGKDEDDDDLLDSLRNAQQQEEVVSRSHTCRPFSGGVVLSSLLVVTILHGVIT